VRPVASRARTSASRAVVCNPPDGSGRCGGAQGTTGRNGAGRTSTAADTVRNPQQPTAKTTRLPQAGLAARVAVLGRQCTAYTGYTDGQNVDRSGGTVCPKEAAVGKRAAELCRTVVPGSPRAPTALPPSPVGPRSCYVSLCMSTGRGGRTDGGSAIPRAPLVKCRRSSGRYHRCGTEQRPIRRFR
jgi:hypothetical protein